jgi:hypothetical protein
VGCEWESSGIARKVLKIGAVGAIVPELDDLVAERQILLPSRASPILSLFVRSALLAGLAIVERTGPAMLEMLHAHTLGENRTRFGQLAATMIARDRGQHDRCRCS